MDLPDPELLYNEKELFAPLLLRIAKGDEAAFKELVVRYNGAVYNFVESHLRYGELVDEVVSDVFMQVWQMREALGEIKHFENYLFIIARNMGFNALRRELREKKRRLKWGMEELDAFEEETRALEDKALGLIDQAVAQLPVQQQKVWILSRRTGLTYKQIAEELRISRETVKSHLQAANAAIKQFILSRINDFPAVVIFMLSISDYYSPLFKIVVSL